MTELNVKGLKSLKKWENYNSWFCPPDKRLYEYKFVDVHWWSSKVKKWLICIAACQFVMSNSSLRHWDMARVNKGSYSFTSHPHFYPQVAWTVPAFTAPPQSVTALWLVLILRSAEAKRLSSPEWLVTNGGGLPACRRSPIPGLTGPVVE